MFLLAVAVDDMLMGITHVVRGDDLLASAPRNAAVIEALGGTPPRYAHVPQVLGPDRKPLSKRHGSTSVEAFREQGFLPEAIVNYLALLGWSPGDDREVLSREELIEAFDLERVSSNPAAFDTEKLTWLNNRYIQSLDDDDLAARCVHFLTEDGLDARPGHAARGDAAREGAHEDPRPRPRCCCGSCSPTTSSRTRRRRGWSRRRPTGYLARAADALEAIDPWDARMRSPAPLDALARAAKG